MNIYVILTFIGMLFIGISMNILEIEPILAIKLHTTLLLVMFLIIQFILRDSTTINNKNLITNITNIGIVIFFMTHMSLMMFLISYSISLTYGILFMIMIFSLTGIILLIFYNIKTQEIKSMTVR